MKKIPIVKIRFVIKHKGEVSDRQLYRTMNISKSSFYRILKRYKDVKLYKIRENNGEPLFPGRESMKLPHEYVTKIIEYRLQYDVGSVSLEKILKEKENILVSHNKINQVIRSANMIKETKPRGKKRSWVRWERKHSLSLWQTDWTMLNGKWLIVFIDDASRLITGWGIFDHATSENSVSVLKDAIKKYGKPKEILTGRDAQFYTSKSDYREQGETEFQEFLKVNNIKHILARVNHPQTCGKVERIFGEVKNRINKWKDFDSLEELVKWHNEVKPHMSLNIDKCETPIEAFHRKMHLRRKIIKLIVSV